jgi:hypothetical protein
MMGVWYGDTNTIPDHNTPYFVICVGKLCDFAATITMPFVQITWIPKACRTAAVRKKVADAVIKVRR